MKRTLKEPEQVERQTVIRRSLLGLDYWLSGGAFLLPFCDYLKIFLYKLDPTVITLWDSADTRHPIFSTHPQIKAIFCEEDGVVIPHSNRIVVCYKLNGDALVCDSAASKALRQLFDHTDFTKSREGTLFGNSLNDAPRIDVHANELNTSVVPPHKSGEEIDWNQEHIAINRAYAAIFKSTREVLKQSPHFQLEGPNLINLFPFVFVAKATAGLDGLEITHQPTLVSEVPRQFLGVFGPEANAAFETGTLTLTERAIPDGLDLNGIKGLATKYQVWVPIHAESTPWIVLLRFLKASRRSHWYDVFHFYHEVIPRIGAMLRTEAKAAYLDLIVTFMSEEIANLDLASFVSRFNKRSVSVLRSFPFPRIYLSDKLSSGNEVQLPDGSKVAVMTEPNRWFHKKEWKYDPLDLSIARDTCERATSAFAKEESRIREKFLRQRHSMVNLNPEPWIKLALLQKRKLLSGAARTYVSNAQRTSNLLFASLDFVTTGKHAPLTNRSLGEILKWLKERETVSVTVEGQPPGPAKAVLQIEKDADYFPQNESVEDIYLVLWNIWHNAARMARGLGQSDTFNVTLFKEKDYHSLTFSHKGEWLKEKLQDLDFLNGTAPPPARDKKLGGLEIVKQSLSRLKWSVTAVGSPEVKIEIRIPYSRTYENIDRR
jgi:hypothetical protein